MGYKADHPCQGYSEPYLREIEKTMADDKQDGQANALTEERIAALVQEKLNAAMANGKKDYTKFETKFETKLNELMERLKPADKDDPEADPPAKRPTVTAVDKKTAELEKMVKSLMDEKNARESEFKSLSLKNTLQESLMASGVSEKLVKSAIKFLKDDVFYNEDGEISMKINNIGLPLDEGLTHWLQTEEAKLFLPPKGKEAKGSFQTGPVKKPANGTATKTQEEILQDALRSRLSQSYNK